MKRKEREEKKRKGKSNKNRERTHVGCSRGRSILACTYTLHHKHCSKPHCDSYTCGCSWVPTGQVDKLENTHAEFSMNLNISTSNIDTLTEHTVQHTLKAYLMLSVELAAFEALHKAIGYE